MVLPGVSLKTCQSMWSKQFWGAAVASSIHTVTVFIDDFGIFSAEIILTAEAGKYDLMDLNVKKAELSMFRTVFINM